jgi:hypothetical protein
VRQLASTPGVQRIAVGDRDPDRAARVARSVGEPVRPEVGDAATWGAADVAVLADGGDHLLHSRRLVGEGVSVVSASADPHDVAGLLALDAEARQRGCLVVGGAGFAPGLSCVLAAHAAAGFDQVDEVHVATVGTGRPAGRGRHRVRGGDACEWVDGQWGPCPSGSGRQLCWFPEPVGPQDCYPDATAGVQLLASAFPGVGRVTSRVGSRRRRERLAPHLPGLGRPPRDGRLGALRVEVRGRRGRVHDTCVLGAVDHWIVAAGATAAVAALSVAEGRLGRTGAGGLAGLVADPPAFLGELWARGVKVAVFEGTATSTVRSSESG